MKTLTRLCLIVSDIALTVILALLITVILGGWWLGF